MKPKLTQILYLLLLVIAGLTACTPVEGVFDVEIQPAAEIIVTDEAKNNLPAISPLDDLKPVALSILQGSYLDVKALVQYTLVPCTTADGLGGPPKCAPGESDGTMIQVFPLGGPESHYVRSTEIEPAMQISVKGLYAVYTVEPAYEPGEFPVGEYALLFDRDENDYPLPIIAFVQNGKLVGLDYKIGISPEEIIKALPVSEVVVAPSEVAGWLGETELISQSTVSDTPVGNWLATSMIVFNPNKGGQMYRNLTITTVEGSEPIRVVDEWLPDVGVGFTFPRPLFWSQTNPVVYWTNTPTPDGCAIFANGYDLHKLDLSSGESSTLLEQGGLWLAVSPDETRVAFINGTTLSIHTIATGEEQSVALPEGQAGQIVWAPSGTQLALTIADIPCGDPTLNTFSIMHVDTVTLEAITLIDHSPERFATHVWQQEEVLLIADKNGITYLMNPITGDYWYTDGRVSENPGWFVYSHNDIAFTFEYPETWIINEQGLANANQEILAFPSNADPSTVYFSILMDDRTMEQIQSTYNDRSDAILTTIQIGGLEAIQYTLTNSTRVEYYVAYQGRIYLISTEQADLSEVKQILASLMFSS